MHTELPVFTRCCFCLPLRYGLIAWGYIKLVCVGFLIMSLASEIISLVEAFNLYATNPERQRIYTIGMTIDSVVLSILIFDFVFSAVFIAGGHLKKVRLLTAFYYYSFGLFVLTALLSIYLLSSYLNSVSFRRSFYRWIWNLLTFSSLFVSLVSQGYFLLLQRSEILKLKNNGEFRFVNNAAQSECKMDDKGTSDENKTKDKDDSSTVISDV